MRNGEYWKKRFNSVEQSNHEVAADCLKDIEAKYQRAQRQIETQLMSWYQRFADNNGISLADARKMLNAKELEELKWDINEYIRHGEENALSGEWTKQLENASSRYHISRLEALKLQIQQQIESLYGTQDKDLNETLRNSYIDGYYRTAFEVQKGVGVGWDFATLDQRQIDKVINNPWSQSGDTFSSTIWKNKQKLLSELDTELTQGIILGRDPQKTIDVMSKKLNTSKSVTGRLVMTESAYFNQLAQHDCFKELDVEKYEIVATLDNRTSEICQDMDGKIFKMSEWEVGVTAPPFHPWCRTTTVPYFDDEFDVGERAARDEDGKTYYVPADMTYKDWKESFVDGNKSQSTSASPMEKSNESDYTVRSKGEFENAVNSIKSEITDYAHNHSKWSGNINVHKDLIDGGAMGVKEWSCDIAVADSADDGVLWHEMLHSCSASYYSPDIYSKHEFIEEGTVEFLKQQICAERNIHNIAAYEDKVLILKIINDAFGYGTDLEFAKEIFNIPLPDRYQWLVDKVDESLRGANASFEDYNEVMLFLRALEGGENR